MTPALLFHRLAAGLDAAALRRAVLAGGAWGLMMAGGMTALEAWRCGFVCLGQAAATLAVATVLGTVTLGPLAAGGGRILDGLATQKDKLSEACRKLVADQGR